ncbi:MAG: hypothetical protein EA427_10645 [Spirochaetaceae bacterium]|nr:MAG: hypothetical protein EA427_10645 [Spirochaetaceae bacterium]
MYQSSDTSSALIIGASYAGLVAAAALKANGWAVRIIERSGSPSRTGGGVVVQPRMMEYLRGRGIGITGVVGVPARSRKIFREDGSVLTMPETASAYTSWDILLRELEKVVGPDSIERGVAMSDILDWGASGEVELSDGTTTASTVVVAADGVGSLTRRLLVPGIEPKYAGYVAWRGMVSEQDLSIDTVRRFQDSLCSHGGKRTHILLYEVPGEDGSIQEGRRRINWVWYESIPDKPELQKVLTDTAGAVHRATLPRGMMPESTLERIRRTASEDLCAPFAEVVHATPEPFMQTIDDLLIPRLVFGRVVLIGDSASLIRPHIGSGTAKAVDDAILLAHALSDGCDEELNCLAAWEHTRLEDHAGLAEYSRAIARRLKLGYDGDQG